MFKVFKRHQNSDFLLFIVFVQYDEKRFISKMKNVRTYFLVHYIDAYITSFPTFIFQTYIIWTDQWFIDGKSSIIRLFKQIEIDRFSRARTLNESYDDAWHMSYLRVMNDEFRLTHPFAER